MNIDISFKDSENIKTDRIFRECEKFAGKRDNEQLPICEAKILSLFHSYYIAYSQKNITNMTRLIQKLTKAASKQPIYYFPDFDQSNLFHLIDQSFYLANELYHSSLLDFFQCIFQHEQFSYQYFSNNKMIRLLLSILKSFNIFQESESILVQSFIVLNEISKKSRKIFFQLIFSNAEFLNLLLGIIRNKDISNEAKIEIIPILMNSSLYKLSSFNFDNLLLFLQQIFDDNSIQFLWSSSFDILNSIIINKDIAENIMLENEFYIQCSKIILDTDFLDIIESIIHVLNSYFKYSSLTFADIVDIIDRVIQLSIENDTLLHPTLCLFDKLIRQGHLDILMNFDIFQFFKNCFQESNYKIKKKILKIISSIIPLLTDEQIIQIIIPFNFMEDFLQILSANSLHKIFNKFIGTITRLLRKKIDYDPPDIFYIQFDESCGVEILEEISDGDDQELALRASTFMEKIYALRPVFQEM